METPLFSGHRRVSVRALFVGQRLDLGGLEQAERLATAPLLVRAGSSGAVALFRYGVVVLFGMDAIEEVGYLDDLKRLVVEPFEQPEYETIDLVADPNRSERVEQAELILHRFTVERLQLVSAVLAKSVVLAHYETRLAQSFDRVEPLAADLQSGNRARHPGRELLRHIGDTLLIHGKMVGRVEVLEKPEVLWEHPELERLYSRLADEYELRERQSALDRKLELIGRTAETLLGLLQSKRSLRVEWYIVILILVEIVLTLYEMFIRHGSAG